MSRAFAVSVAAIVVGSLIVAGLRAVVNEWLRDDGPQDT